MWHVSSRSGVATLRTAIHLLLTYSWLLTIFIRNTVYHNSVYSRHLLGDPPQDFHFPPLPNCVLEIFFFGQGNELQIHHGNISQTTG